MKVAITTLITNILVLSMLGIIANMSLPNGSFKRYSKFIINITMVTMILKSFLNINNEIWAGGNIGKGKTLEDIKAIESKGQAIDAMQKQQMEELFKKKIEHQITMQLNSVIQCEDIVATVRLENTAEYMYNIRDIHVKAKAPKTNSPIEIEFKKANENIDGIVDYLASIYNVPKDKIVIDIYR